MTEKQVVILGSTGSIGRQALEVVEAHPERLHLVALTASTHWRLLAEQARRFRPERVVIGDERHHGDLKAELAGLPVAVEAGEEAVLKSVREPRVNLVLAAQAGLAGLRPVLAALEAGKVVALANKEPLVAAGDLVMAAGRLGVNLLPVDSEHSAIFQLIGRRTEGVRRLVLTASGGPFRDWPAERLDEVTAEDALRHPNWRMGPKITVDSATLMNKGLEILEAHRLFALPLERIDAALHPESIVHSLVDFSDGSTLAQLGWPDMRVPIQYAFSFPKRWEGPVPGLDLLRVGELHFRELRREAFPCLRLAVEAGKMGGTMPAVLSAANEVAVSEFLKGRAGFRAIPATIEAVLGRHSPRPVTGLGAVLEADRWARAEARRVLEVGG